MASVPDRPQWVRNIAPFFIGGVSGSVAATCIHPIDMIKVRMQLAGEGAKGRLTMGPLAFARTIAAEGSILSLYNGLSAAYLRQWWYTTLRIGFFDSFLKFFQKGAAQKGTTVGFGERATAALAGGGLSSFLANPAEVALVRMQSDGLRPAAERMNYRSVFHALVDISRKEGVAGLWKGVSPTVIRAMATNFGQLAFFSESKSRMKGSQISNQGQTIIASSVAGFFATFFSLPFDFLKTRLQRQASSSSGTPQYRGMMDCAVQVIRNEGILRFYRGFGMYFLRIAPHTVITLTVADNLRALIQGQSF